MKKFFSIKNKYFIAFVVLIVIYFLWSEIWMTNIIDNDVLFFGPEEPGSQLIARRSIIVYSVRISLILTPALRIGIAGTGLKLLYDILKKLDLC